MNQGDESDLRVMSNSWIPIQMKGSTTKQKYIGEFKLQTDSNDSKQVNCNPDGRGIMRSGDDKGETIYVGYFKNGYLHGEAWEIPQDAHQKGNDALSDWSFEEQDYEEPYGTCLLTQISFCWWGKWHYGQKEKISDELQTIHDRLSKMSIDHVSEYMFSNDARKNIEIDKDGKTIQIKDRYDSIRDISDLLKAGSSRIDTKTIEKVNKILTLRNTVGNTLYLDWFKDLTAENERDVHGRYIYHMNTLK